jgi:HD-GYP domain-containing protein (c-di-GMP phosphodiesterase class II)
VAWNSIRPMLTALAAALAARDPSTAAHCTRVTLLAARVAVWMGWDDDRLRTLALGGPLHDLGKVMISETILNKRGPLEPDEVAEIRKHPAAGARLIGPVWPAQEALPYVLYHHERWDGGGYPTGRSGEDIPEEARLLAVADAFDAMTSMRPYRRALPIAAAVQEVERCAGSQFDPMVANAFLEAWSAGALEATAAAS